MLCILLLLLRENSRTWNQFLKFVLKMSYISAEKVLRTCIVDALKRFYIFSLRKEDYLYLR